MSPILDMTVAENLYLGRFPRKNGLIDYSQLYRNAAELFAQLRFQINPWATMRELSLANIQLVEIAKALLTFKTLRRKREVEPTFSSSAAL
ncbi:MAG TPA: sugar ABC transporter ATP-binding protein, partial [Chthoniobacterales bacterium]|nr:sugar ABC transporter ATP-binding protein [Chthoniobacterales bacterium]